jgi:hypothetical protein
MRQIYAKIQVECGFIEKKMNFVDKWPKMLIMKTLVLGR